MGNPIGLLYGDVTPPRVCKLHGGLADRFGTLVDPNGHRWVICADCINGLWTEKQPNPNESAVDPIDAAMDVLKRALKDRGYSGD